MPNKMAAECEWMESARGGVFTCFIGGHKHARVGVLATCE